MSRGGYKIDKNSSAETRMTEYERSWYRKAGEKASFSMVLTIATSKQAGKKKSLKNSIGIRSHPLLI